MVEERVQIEVHDPARRPTLVYLPGLHGDSTLAGPIRDALAGRLSFVTATYPRSNTLSIGELGAAVGGALTQHRIDTAWLLAESFGSQVAWALQDPHRQIVPLRIQGLILAGGFVRYPWPGAVRLCAWLLAATPPGLFHWLPRVYFACLELRSRQLQPHRETLRTFIRRRHTEDLQAMVHRLRLLATNDPRPIAHQARLPVYHLVGGFDPIVPAPLVRRWLRRHCPGFQGGHTILAADHNVLVTGTPAAANCILTWIGSAQIEG